MAIKFINGDRNLDITNSLESKIFPELKNEDFAFETLMPKVKCLAEKYQSNHPWAKMSDMDLLKDAGLYHVDSVQNQSGFNFAAVLLFGKDKTIRDHAHFSDDKAECHKTIDYLVVHTNLICAYDQLMDFIFNHASEKICLIAHELVVNMLVHRDYSSKERGRITVEQDCIVTENKSSSVENPGRIDPKKITPYPKNPLLINFFKNIGLADASGSGIRKLFAKKFKPEVTIKDNFFKIIVPIHSKKKSNIPYCKMVHACFDENNNEITVSKALAFIEKQSAEYSKMSIKNTSIKRAVRRVLKQLTKEKNVIKTEEGQGHNTKYKWVGNKPPCGFCHRSTGKS